MAKPDLNKLKNEIDSRKRERTTTSTPNGDNAAPRDVFLNGLLESYKTGRETTASARVKSVNNKAAEKLGEKNLQITESAPVVQQPQQSQDSPRRITNVDMSPERDELLWAEVERKKKMTLAEQIGDFRNTPSVGAPMNNNVKQPSALNEVYLTENMKKYMDNYLVENLGPVFEEAIKGTIIEMYAAERIKEVLAENKDMIKELVKETIREIQKANADKKKAQS
jgi:hypothetical protein